MRELNDHKKRVSDKTMDDAVHRLALMYVEANCRTVITADSSPEFVAQLPELLADEYCDASERIRKRINEQRLTDGTYPPTWGSNTKCWFDTPTVEQILSKDCRDFRT